MTLSPVYEWGASNAARDHLLGIRTAMFDLLHTRGPMAPGDLAGLLGLGISATVQHANRWPAYFQTTQDRGEKRRTVMIAVHEHLRRSA